MDDFELKDPARLRALDDTGLLAAPPHAAFDRVTRLARRTTGAPMALLSVVGADRQVFVSADGLGGEHAGLRELPLSHSFCQHVVRQRAALVIQDARRHPLVADNASVEDLGVAAYLGVPFRAPGGEVLGALCAIEHAPRPWSLGDLAAVSDLGALAAEEVAAQDRVRTLEDRVHLAEDRRADRDALAQLAFFHSSSPLALVSGPALRVELVNAAFAALVGAPSFELLGGPLADLVQGGGADRLGRRALVAPSSGDALLRTTGGALRDVRFSTRPAVLDGRACALVTVEDTSELRRVEGRLHDREALLSLAVDAARFGVWSTDLQTGATFWDARCREIFGVGPDAPASVEVGRSLLHPDDREGAAAAFEAALASADGRYRVEKRLLLPDGSVRHVFAVGQVVRGADGAPTQILGLAAETAAPPTGGRGGTA